MAVFIIPILGFFGLEMFTAAPSFEQNPECTNVCNTNSSASNLPIDVHSPVKNVLSQVPIVNWAPSTIATLLILATIYFVAFKSMAKALGANPTLINFALMLMGWAWGWATATPILTDSGSFLFGASDYEVFLKRCKCHEEHNASCNKPDGYYTGTQWYIMIASIISAVLGGVLLVFEIATPLKVTPLGIIRMLVVMVLGMVGLVPTRMTTMAMMVVIGVLVTTHFGFLRASGCNADFGPFVSYGIPWLAVLSPFVNGIAVIVYDRIFTRRSFSQSFEAEEHSMNNLVNGMGNDMEQRMMTSMMTRYRKKISNMKAAKKAEGARYLSRKNSTPSLKKGFKVREFKPEFKKFRK
jgi:hypothetical protein